MFDLAETKNFRKSELFEIPPRKSGKSFRSALNLDPSQVPNVPWPSLVQSDISSPGIIDFCDNNDKFLICGPNDALFFLFLRFRESSQSVLIILYYIIKSSRLELKFLLDPCILYFCLEIESRPIGIIKAGAK